MSVDLSRTRSFESASITGRRRRGMMKPATALDGVNFFLADVRDGLGPYLAIYLLTTQHWDAASIGVVMSISGISGLVAQTPIGALIDATHRKRLLVAGASAVIAICCIGITLAPSFTVVAAAKATMGVMASVFAPAVSAMTLGIVGQRRFAERIGRNEAFNHAGNVVAAVLAGVLGYVFSPAAIAWLVAVMAVGSIFSVSSIDGRAIDHARARGLARHDHDPERPSGFSVLLRCRPLLIFTACVTLFHFANAAMLPLVGQELATEDMKDGSLFMSACIIAAQAVMVPMAILVGRKADAWGRKPLFLLGFAVLPLRGLLYTAWHSPFFLISVQLLDGVGAGIYGALFPLVVADLTEGTGHYNVSQGAVSTAQGIGASLSTSAAGLIVVAAGYDAAFLALAGIALAALLLFLVAMPETKRAHTSDELRRGLREGAATS
jgi:MFS family permease